jgi:hypothetical protein
MQHERGIVEVSIDPPFDIVTLLRQSVGTYRQMAFFFMSFLMIRMYTSNMRVIGWGCKNAKNRKFTRR